MLAIVQRTVYLCWTMDKVLSDIGKLRKAVLARIQASAQQAARPPSEICLVAVSKRQSQQKIDALWQVGQRVFGENQIAEAEQHWPSSRRQEKGFRLHLIGHLQSNKAERAIVLFDVIETLSSIKLAVALDKAMMKTGRHPQIFVQVNTGEEPQKHGINPMELPQFLEQLSQQTNIKPVGLMCLPPQQDEAGLHFALLAKLGARAGLSKLSMGMSADFETAIRFGATSVRVGSSLFGERET